MIKVIVAGAAGRMGGRIIDAVLGQEDMELSAAFERPDHPDLGKDIGLITGQGELGLPLAGSLDEVIGSGDVIINFTSPEATMAVLELASTQGKAVVVGTTGLTDEHRSRIKQLSRVMRVVFAPNMSIGVNLLFKLVKDVARILGPGFDLEIIETHHRMKKDAPSGTAIKLAEVMAEATGRDIAACGVYGRQGMVGERRDDEIAVLAVRAGDIVGEHTILFGGLGERIEITHRAHSRDTFAQGAVRAARWLVDKPNGLYDMQDVLGIG
jgi:4-hydroxy-tetrahydrodipicolinate reductase